MDFFQHKMGIAALFRSGHFPRDMLRLLFNLFAQSVIERGAVAVEYDHIAVVEVDDLTGVF